MWQNLFQKYVPSSFQASCFDAWQQLIYSFANIPFMTVAKWIKEGQVKPLPINSY